MRKLRSSALFISISLLILLSSAGCSLSMNDMLDSYNSKFQSGDSNSKEDPNSPDYEEDLMLLPHYAVREDSTITLSAPPGCESYEWQLYKQDGSNQELTPKSNSRNTNTDETEDDSRHTRIMLREMGINDNSQIFSVWIPNYKIDAGTYKLVLIVQKKFGDDVKTWKDQCTLVIFKPVAN